jgi:hypothetical protein
MLLAIVFSVVIAVVILGAVGIIFILKRVF